MTFFSLSSCLPLLIFTEVQERICELRPTLRREVPRDLLQTSQYSRFLSVRAVRADSRGHPWGLLLNKSRAKAKATHLWIRKNGVPAFLSNFLKGFKLWRKLTEHHTSLQHCPFTFRVGGWTLLTAMGHREFHSRIVGVSETLSLCRFFVHVGTEST